jgi:peroxiredoxin (alkyl hydroperoxide reductase subunit C)
MAQSETPMTTTTTPRGTEPTARVGQTVPNFKLEIFNPVAGDFSSRSLDDVKKAGKWTVLFFYPADFTFVCATEFQALAEQHDKFTEIGAEIITVSTDTVYTHLAWQQHEKELEKVKYLMGSDRTGAVAKMFGVLDEASGNALRGTFVISPDGKLMNSEVNFFNLGRNINELYRKVKASTYLAKHGTEACPAKWNSDGDATLKPGPGLVGKVHEALKGK